MSRPQRSSSVPNNLTEDPPSSMALRSRNINRPSGANSRRSRRFSMTPSSPSPISKDPKILNKASVLAIAHLISSPPASPLAVNDDQAVGGLSHTDDDDDCTIVSIKTASSNKTIPGADENGDTHVPEYKARLRNYLPSYRKLCRTAGVPISVRSNRHEDTEPAIVDLDSKDHNMAVVSSHVVQNSNGGIAGYMSAMQHSAHPSQDTAGTRQPIPNRETVATSGIRYLQQLRQHRSAIFEEIFRNSITTTLSTRVRASVADEVRGRYAHRLLEHERTPKYAHSLLRARGRRYWVGMYEFKEMPSHYGGQQEARETQLIDEIYSRRDRAIAIYFWALHHERMRYTEICFELSLPLGALVQWLLQISA